MIHPIPCSDRRRSPVAIGARHYQGPRTDTIRCGFLGAIQRTQTDEKNEKNPSCELTGENMVIKFHAVNILIVGYQPHKAAVVGAYNIVLADFSRQRGRTLTIFTHTVKVKVAIYRN